MTTERENFDSAELNEPSNGQSYISSTEPDEGSDDSAVIVEESRSQLSRGTIAMFVILVVGAAGVYFMYRKAGPASASAATPQAVQAKQTISTFLSGGDTSIKTMEALIRNTEKVVKQFLNYPSMTQIPLSDLHTNPFRVHTEATVKTADSSLSEAAEKKRREEERLAILKAVQGLQLQSVMCGDTRKACMINSSLYLEGQSVDDFNIEKISPSGVIVKNGTYRFELRMQR